MKCPKCYDEERYCEECQAKEKAYWEGQYRAGRLLPQKCDGSTDCGDSDCQECCPHDEHDHGICLDCEKDILDDLIRDAEDAFEREE